MLPEGLVDTYKKYKSNTAEFLTWLVTSSPLSANPPHQSHNDQQQGGPRLKGKARRAAKEELTTKKHAIAICQIVPLAQGLARDKSSTPHVPVRALNVLQRAITLRKRCATWYSQEIRSGEAAQESLQGHTYFISILENTLDILKSYCAPMKTSMATGKIRNRNPLSAPGPVSNNIYRHLKTDDVASSDEAEHIPFLDPPCAKSPILLHEQAGQLYEPETSDDEIAVAAFCVLEDLESLRSFVRQTWEKYRDSDVTLINASTCTNTAIEFARGIEENAMKSFPQFSNWAEIMMVIFPVLTERYGLEPDKLDDEAVKRLDSIYWWPFMTLLDIVDPLHGMARQPMVNDYYDPRLDISKLSLAAVRDRDRILLRHILCEYRMAIFLNLPTVDELTAGILRLFSSGKIDLWLVFALQILVDIHHVLGENVDRGALELRSAGLEFISTIDVLFDSNKDLELVDHDTDHILSWHRELIEETIIQDVFAKHRPSNPWYGNAAKLYRLRPYFFLSQHPLLCGVMLSALTLNFKSASFHFMNLGTGIAVVHLYNAVREAGFMHNVWPEMENLMAIWTKQRFFAGKAPTDRGEFYKQYLLVTGISPATFASKRRDQRGTSPTIIRNRKGNREPFKYSPTLQKFLAWYCKGGRRSEVTTADMESLVKSMLTTSPSRSKAHRQAHMDHMESTTSPSHMLTLLRDAFAVEEPLMSPDYMWLYYQTYRLLFEIEKVTHESLIQWLNCNRRKQVNWQPNQLLGTVSAFIFDSYHNLPNCKGTELMEMATNMIEARIKDSEIRQQMRSDAVRGEFIDSAANRDIPELSAATLWGILQPNHPTRNGECIHPGICGRQILPLEDASGGVIYALTLNNKRQGTLSLFTGVDHSATKLVAPEMEISLEYSSGAGI